MKTEVINSNISEAFSDCTKINTPKIIIDRINSIRDVWYSHLYVEIWTLSKGYFFEIFPDIDSVEYNDQLNALEFTSDGGMLLSSVKFDDADIYYRAECFESTDETNEYIHVVYPSSGNVITFEVIRVAA